MNIVVIGHPEGFLGSQSMPRLARYVCDGLRERGHGVQQWSARAASASSGAGKWWGYVEQFLFFSVWLWWSVRRQPNDTVYFFLDQALAPWVWCVGSRPHVLQVNDLLAVRSARGEFKNNPVGWSGRVYQALIAAGLRRARHFIAISEATRQDVVAIAGVEPERVDKVYVGLNHPYRVLAAEDQASRLAAVVGDAVPAQGFLLHVGGNQWYKNRVGVLHLYLAYASQFADPPELWVVGAPPSAEGLAAADAAAKLGGRVRYWSGIDNDQLNALYCAARLLLFPSLAEGFGWPIAEAMACGCLVLTSRAAPMTEVGGEPAFYVPVMPVEPGAVQAWAALGARVMHGAITLTADERATRVADGFRQVAHFATERAIERYETVCERVLHQSREVEPRWR